MPKHSSYQKLALVYALNGFGGDYNRSREEARTLYIFREFIDNQMILLQDRIDFLVPETVRLGKWKEVKIYKEEKK